MRYRPTTLPSWSVTAKTIFVVLLSGRRMAARVMLAWLMPWPMICRTWSAVMPTPSCGLDEPPVGHRAGRGRYRVPRRRRPARRSRRSGCRAERQAVLDQRVRPLGAARAEDVERDADQVDPAERQVEAGRAGRPLMAPTGRPAPDEPPAAANAMHSASSDRSGLVGSYVVLERGVLLAGVPGVAGEEDADAADQLTRPCRAGCRPAAWRCRATGRLTKVPETKPYESGTVSAWVGRNMADGQPGRC